MHLPTAADYKYSGELKKAASVLEPPTKVNFSDRVSFNSLKNAGSTAEIKLL